jgi:hypothetical protein
MNIWRLALCAALIAPACDKGANKNASGDETPKDTPEAEKKEPPKGDWEDETLGAKLVFPGKTETVDVRLTGKRGKLILVLSGKGFPKGSKLGAAGRKTTSDSDFLHLEAPLEDFKLGEVSLADVQDNDATVDPGASIEVSWPDTKPFSAKVPRLKVRLAADGALEDIAKAPVAFKGEPAADGKVDSILLLDINGHIDEVIGSGKTLQDVDLIAAGEHIKTDRSKKCTGYEKGDIELHMVDRNLVAYDRRTGNKVQEKLFKGKEECPSVAFVSKDNKSDAWPDTDEMVAWLKTLLR